MATLKTQPRKASVKAFLDTAASGERRTDCDRLLNLLKDVSGEPPVMWGASIVGFGRYRYDNTQGGGEWMLTGFSPRKQNLTVYIMNGFSRYPDLMAKLGKHKTGKSCLYIKKLSDVDVAVLRELVTRSLVDMRKKHSF
ncbi:DUF1801 domain-containing protein [bacterium SCSIO 12696]|nr:DUF1801 domain-containing protein [bacterium SCSIO 12696]